MTFWTWIPAWEDFCPANVVFAATLKWFLQTTIDHTFNFIEEDIQNLNNNKGETLKSEKLSFLGVWKWGQSKPVGWWNHWPTALTFDLISVFWVKMRDSRWEWSLGSLLLWTSYNDHSIPHMMYKTCLVSWTLYVLLYPYGRCFVL